MLKFKIFLYAHISFIGSLLIFYPGRTGILLCSIKLITVLWTKPKVFKYNVYNCKSITKNSKMHCITKKKFVYDNDKTKSVFDVSYIWEFKALKNRDTHDWSFWSLPLSSATKSSYSSAAKRSQSESCEKCNILWFSIMSIWVNMIFFVYKQNQWPISRILSSDSFLHLYWKFKWNLFRDPWGNPHRKWKKPYP